jgi:beta-N-acetylhexosaminidase
MPVLAALASALALASATSQDVAALSPSQKAALVVVSGLPAPSGVGGVIVQRSTRGLRPPPDTLVLADQEGGAVRAYANLPPARPARAFTTTAQAFVAGAATGRALRPAGADVDLAPVLDSPDGPLGARHFRRASLGVAFARGLASAGIAACAKHFPGLGSAAVSTDHAPHVDAVLRPRELAGFRAAVRAGVPCVMVDHAFYGSLGRRRASLEPTTYHLLRGTGFQGVAITDSLSIVRRPPADWPARAATAGADLLLFTDPKDAAQAIRKLIPLARRGALDEHVERVLRFKDEYWRG